MAPWPAAAGRRSAVAALVLLSAIALAATGCSAVDGVTGGGTAAVVTPAGALDGLVDGGTRRFLGVRYAEAPVGDRRWAAPVPAGPWTGTRPATASGPACPQQSTNAATASQDEDCLFLDVTTPADLRPGERLPVLLWWHGGGYVTGSGSEYDARRLAEQGRLVVVTANYRLGALGYLGLPGLPLSGAFGFADQVQSLRWTHDSIAAFGGDPGNVTVAGESAGGAATCALLGSPALTAYSVRHVVVMSGACSSRFPANGLGLRLPARGLYTSTAEAQAAGRRVAVALGCSQPDPTACLRALPRADVLRWSSEFTALAWGNALLPADPATRLSSVPPSVSVLYGGMRDEARSFFRRGAAAAPALFTPAGYAGLVAQGFGPDAGRVLAQYPVAASGNSGALAWSTVVTDDGWSCPARRDQRTLATAGVPTYAYEFTRPDGPIGADGVPAGGAPHASELPLLFDLPYATVPPSETALSDTVVAYWSSFARTGRPAVAGAPAWPAVTPGAAVTVQRLGPTGVEPADVGAEHRCDFWSTVR